MSIIQGPRFKHSGCLQDNMDAKETSEVERTADVDIKQEPLDSEPPDSSTDTMDESMTKIVVEILPMVEDPAAPEIKFLTVKEDNNLEHTINSDIKQEPTADMELIKGIETWEVKLEQLPTYTHSDIKQEPMDSDQIDSEESEQHEPQDIKYVKTQDYLDIGGTMISEHDRAKPGPSAKRDVKLKTKSSKNKTTRLLAGRKQFECDVCSYQSRRRVDFETHIRKHTGEKPYKCKICNYKSGAQRLLKRHIRTHTGEKPHKCEMCDYKSGDQSDLTRHINRTHIGVKLHKCEKCDYKCVEKRDLTRHMITHTGEKPYKCAICDFRGKQQSYLKRHMRTHAGQKPSGVKPYKCEVCDYQCRQLCNLKTHLRRHTGEKPFKCHICGYRCGDQANIKRHIKTHTK